MTRPRPLRRWDPFRPLDMLASLWSTAAVAPVSSGAAAAYRTLFMTLRRLVVGRRLAVRLDDGDVTLTVTEFDSRLDVRGLSVGQLNDVRLAARDISWGGNQFERASAVLHNVHIRPAAPPVLVAAPVELTLEVPSAVLDDLFSWAAPRLVGEVGPDGIARLRLARRPTFGPSRGGCASGRIDPVAEAAQSRRPANAVDLAAADARLPGTPSRASARTAADRRELRSRPGVPVGHSAGMADGRAAHVSGGHHQPAQRRGRTPESHTTWPRNEHECDEFQSLVELIMNAANSACDRVERTDDH